MIDRNRMDTRWGYDVTLGHSRVHVLGYSREDAIREARLVLASQHPRLYDVINTMDAGRFDVVQSSSRD